MQTFAIQCSRRCVLLHWSSCKCNHCWPQISAANGGTGGEFGTIKVSEILALSFIIKLENNLAAANWQKSRATKAQRKRQWKNDVNAWEHRRVGWLLLETHIQMKGFSRYNVLGKCAEWKWTPDYGQQNENATKIYLLATVICEYFINFESGNVVGWGPHVDKFSLRGTLPNFWKLQ